LRARAEALQVDNDILTSELQAAKDEAGEQAVTHAG
jgi:outer membrane murein-binding lipoprotein Lpp